MVCDPGIQWTPIYYIQYTYYISHIKYILHRYIFLTYSIISVTYVIRSRNAHGIKLRS